MGSYNAYGADPTQQPPVSQTVPPHTDFSSQAASISGTPKTIPSLSASNAANGSEPHDVRTEGPGARDSFPSVPPSAGVRSRLHPQEQLLHPQQHQQLQHNPSQNIQQQHSSFLNSSNIWLMPPPQAIGNRGFQYQLADPNMRPAGNSHTGHTSGVQMPLYGVGSGNVYMPPLPMPPPFPNAQQPSHQQPLASHQQHAGPQLGSQLGSQVPQQIHPHVPQQFPISSLMPPPNPAGAATHPPQAGAPSQLPTPTPPHAHSQPQPQPQIQPQPQSEINNAHIFASQLGPPFSEVDLSKEARSLQSGMAATFKPITPKKNSRPRINKLNNQVDKKVMKKVLKVDDNDYQEAEPSTDPYFVHFLNSLKLAKEETAPTSPAFYSVDSVLEKKLFDLFIHQVSTSMDMFMMGNFFSDIVPEMALLDESGLILSSMYSLSALMLQRIDPDSIDSSIPINYYHQTIKSIRHHLSLPGSGNVSADEHDGIIARCLLSTILLCVYEMFFLATDNTYVKGAVSLLTSIISKTEDKSPLKNSPFLQMCFWAMFVCDLILSLKFNLPTMFSVKQFWLQIDPEFIEQYINPIVPKPTPSPDINNGLFIGKKEAIWWLHRALISFSIVNEFNCQVTVLTDEEFKNNKIFHDWLELSASLDEFERCLPEALKPIIYKPSSTDSNGSIYPTIYFRDELSALISLQFKLAKVSLYQALIQKTNLDSPEVQAYISTVPRNHAKLLAKDIIGTLITYDLNLQLWPINIHTIRQVARYLHDDQNEYRELEYLMERVIDTCHFIFQTKLIIG